MKECNLKVLVTGGSGMVGGALVRALELKKGKVALQILSPSRDELDLEDTNQVRNYFLSERPDHVYMAAAKVGSIEANSKYPVDFNIKNIKIQLNIIESSFYTKVDRLLFLGASCIYPKYAPQPIKETSLLTGALEPTNEAYAIAKIAGLRLCNAYHSQYGSDFRCIVPCSLVGLGDNFSVEESHVIPALIRKFHEAKIAEHPSVTIWGTGAPVREFMDVDDLADACIFVMSRSKEVFHGKASELGGVVNIGSGHEITILRLAKLIAGIVGFRGKILTDPTKPDGTPRKIVNSAGITSMGWSPARDLESGVKLSYQEFLDKHCRKNPLTQ